jgi:hypothetical protein
MPAQAPFNADATNRQELMSSRTPRFIEIDIRAAKGERLTREERQLVEEFSKLSREVGRYDPADYDSLN